MKSKAYLLILTVITAFTIGGCGEKPESRIHVTATTTMMQSAIREIGGEKVSVSVLIPPGSCPGHYDIRPGDIQNIKKSRALFIHGYEQFIPRLMESVGEPHPRVCRVPVEGNWMIPATYKESCCKVALLLSGINPGNKEYYRSRLISLSKSVDETDRDIQQRIKDTGACGTAVICSNQQAPLLEWMGLNVAGTYGRPDEFTPAQLHKLVLAGRKKNVSLVADNLQSGPDAGVQLAKEIGASHVTLSNFPGGFANTSTWKECLLKNAELMLSALSSTQEK